MEPLGNIPEEVARYNPAYEHLTMWLTEQGLQPQQVTDLAVRSYTFQLTATGLLGTLGELGIGITGKIGEEGVTPSLRYRLVWPGGIAPADEIRPQIERELQANFARQVAEPSHEVVNTELFFVTDLEVEDHHIGFIGLTREGHEELARGLRKGAVAVERNPEAGREMYDLVQKFPDTPEEERPAAIQRIKDLVTELSIEVPT